jgi:hypothetical protein
MLEYSAFRDFLGALFKLSLEMAGIQSGVEVGAGTGTTEGNNNLVGSVFSGRWCVMSSCLCLPQFRERTEQLSSDFGIARPGDVAVLNHTQRRVPAI